LKISFKNYKNLLGKKLNLCKKLLNEGRPTIGSWCQVGHPANAEILAKAGFSWIAADCEHGEFESCEIGNFCRAVSQYSCTPLVRVKENDNLEIRRALDLGAMGVIIPLVNNADDAERAVAAAKYPPQGIRGFAFHRGNNWGVDFDEYVKCANEEIMVIVMIESKEAVENIELILAVDGVDGVFIGPYDMSGSYGIIGQTSTPEIKGACRKVSEACKKAGKAAGMHIVLPTAEAVKNAVADGFTFLALGMDTVFLANGAKQALEMIEND
jgi:2-keto-3-deoxy-L-rhamnonate aldolase RhmA